MNKHTKILLLIFLIVFCLRSIQKITENPTIEGIVYAVGEGVGSLLVFLVLYKILNLFDKVYEKHTK